MTQLTRSRLLTFVCIVLITLIGFSLRVFKLTEIPPGFFADEASIGYNSYTIITKGADEEGRKFPILFKNFGDFYRPGISIYFTAPFVASFGLSEWSVRIAAATAGTLSLVLIFFVTRLLFNSNISALLSAVFLAISPWHIHMSRIGQEFIYLPFFILLSLFLFLFGLRKNRDAIYLLSFVALGATLYTYVTAYFIVPLLTTSLIIVYRREIWERKKSSLIGFFIIFIISLPLILGVSSGKTFSRFNQISAAGQEKTRYEAIQKITRTYLDHFSPSFLFLDGDAGYPGHFITRFSVRDMGQIYLFQLPLLIAGLVFITRNFNKSAQLTIALLVIYPLGSTFAPFADGGGPFAMRSVTGTIPLHLITGIGVFYILKNLQLKIKIITSVLIFVISIISLHIFTYKYFFEYSFYAADFWGWQFGAKGIMQTFLKESESYDELYMEGKFNAPSILIKFYDPENRCLNKCMVGEQDKYNQEKKQLFAFSPEFIYRISEDFDFNVKETLFYPNGTTAFSIGELSKKP